MNFEVIIERETEKTVKVLEKGGIIVYPTDTIWGIGCDATIRKSVEKIYKIKHRSQEKSFIVLISSKEELFNYVDDVPEILWDLAAQYTAPLTVIYPSAKNLPDNIFAPDGSIAIRITKDAFCCSLIKKLGNPIISTSANISGDIAPLTYSMIKSEILNNADYVVDFKRDKVTEVRPSTIVKITKNGGIDILRN